MGRAAGTHDRGRRARLVAAAMLFAGLGLGLAPVDPPAAQAGDYGDALLSIFEDLPSSIEYGQDTVFHGAATDMSLSCLSITFDCDEPAGYVYIQVNEVDGRYLAVADLTPYGEGNGDLSFWGPMTLGGTRLLPGQHLLYFGMESTFSPTGYTWSLTVRKIACSINLQQSSPSSNPNDPVTFTATINGNGDHSGRMVFTDQRGDLLANPTIVDGRATFTTAALPQGTTTVQAEWSDGHPTIYDTCANRVYHTVATDPPPTALDDTYHVEAGRTITVHPLANDHDIGPGPLRAEYLDSPDLGDAESLDVDGTTLRYTAPEDTVGFDQVHYIAYDGIGQSSNEATVHFEIGCQPEARPDTYAVPYGTTLTVDGPGVYDNDSRCDLPTEVVTPPAHGTLTYHGDTGGFTYTPAAGSFGPDSFTYRYSQGLGSPVDATVRLDVGLPITPTSSTTTTTTTTTTTAPPPSSSTTTTTPAPPPPTPTAAEATVTGWYATLLGRAPEPAGLGHWSALLDEGARPLTVTRQIVGTEEFRRRVGRDAYRICLGRAPDADGLAYWAARLARGASPDQVRVGMLASAEAWSAAGGDPVAWAGRVYEALVGRAPTPAEAVRVGEGLRAGDRRSEVVLAVATAPEARRHLALLWYQALVGRRPTAGESAAWAAAMAAGTRELALVAELASTTVAVT